jgi:glycosyltransferase involved in cell wall biosynthesis
MMISAESPMLTVVSRSFPPQVSASSIVLSNLLSEYTGNLSAVAGYTRYTKTDPDFLPPCTTRYPILPRLLSRVYRRLRRRSISTLSRILTISVWYSLGYFKTSVVMGLLPQEDLFVASFLAARRRGLPFYAHMHDLWTENTTPGTNLGRFAELWEPIILKEATRVICMTEAMQNHYKKKYGLETDLLPHCITDQACSSMPDEMRPPQIPQPTILYLGEVSPPMNHDALKVLAAASELLPDVYQLLFCTSSNLPSLERLGIRSTRLRVRAYGSRADVQDLVSRAHLLVAPLSHKNCSPNEVKTVFSGKLLDYLVSGRPILVFAPEDAYHVQSAKMNGWAYTVTEDSSIGLASAITKVVTDESLSRELVCNALKEARRRNAKHHVARLQKWVITDTDNRFG